MGSLFGKSTAEPTGMANTCGVKCFSFCTIRKWWGGTLPGGSPLVGSSHTTTPEKSLLWRTPGSRESVSTTLPLTLAHQAGMSQRPLKQIRQSQVEAARAQAPHQVAGQLLEGHVVQPRRIPTIGDVGVDGHPDVNRVRGNHREQSPEAGRILRQQQSHSMSPPRTDGI